MNLNINRAAIFIGLLSITSVACARIRGQYWELKVRHANQREMAIRADMNRIANDKMNVYRFDYVLSDYWLAYYLDDSIHPRALPDGRFDITPKLRYWGINPTEKTSAVIDRRKRTLTICDIGSNVTLIATCLEPMAPKHHCRITSNP